MALQTLRRMACAGLIPTACTLNTHADAARVDCGKPGPHGVECSVQRTGATTAFDACWDLAITCQKGGERVSPTCQRMAVGEPVATATMSVARVAHRNSCGAPVTGKVQRVKVISP